MVPTDPSTRAVMRDGQLAGSVAETLLVPDTSVLVDGRITQCIESGEYSDAKVLVPRAALAELEAQANRGLETGFAGLDELRRLQTMAHEGTIRLEYVGVRPPSEEIERAATGAVDARIRDAAEENQGILVTSDRVQAYAAGAQGVAHHYLRPIVDEAPDLAGLEVSRFFDETTMSVHLRTDCLPMAKRGTPGDIAYQQIGSDEIGHKEIRRIARECIEFAKRDYNSFLEAERHGCTVVQLGNMRIVIAQPPFSDALEITAVRPVTKTSLSDYDLPEEILRRIEGKARGVFVSGQPGSGKSTFVAAVGEHLHGLNRVVKTMEQPRDLQVPREVTQYGALDRDMAWTGEVMLLVRPDHVLYDEVRTTDDFRVFADMRLAGVGLFGVTHANRPIDAVQRLIGRVELGMIPQVVDTVVFIEDGAIRQILELEFTVRVPAGMTEADLARPIVIVKDVSDGRELFELYTYGEQVVVMPLEGLDPGGKPSRSEAEVARALRRHAKGPMDIEITGNKATVYVMDFAVPSLLGRGGKTIQSIERRLGMRIDVRSMDERPRGPSRAAEVPHDPNRPRIRKTGKNVFLILDPEMGGREYAVLVEDAVVGEAKASQQGKLRFKTTSPEGKAIKKAVAAGLDVQVREIP